MRQGKVRHVVVMQQIELERSDEFFGAAMLEAHAVVYAGILDQRIDSAESVDCFFDGLRAILSRLKIGNHVAAAFGSELQLRKEFLARRLIPIDDYGDSAFSNRRSRDRRSNPLRATRDEHDVIVQL